MFSSYSNNAVSFYPADYVTLGSESCSILYVLCLLKSKFTSGLVFPGPHVSVTSVKDGEDVFVRT